MEKSYIPFTSTRRRRNHYVPARYTGLSKDEEPGYIYAGRSLLQSIKLSYETHFLATSIFFLFSILLIAYQAGQRQAVSYFFPQNQHWGHANYFFHPPIGRASSHLPQPPPYNVVPDTYEVLEELRQAQAPATPLFIPFTQHHKVLEQAVLSYIAAGWPRSDIIVIENTGTMDANPKGLLTPSNPFYLNYDLLRRRYGVSILQTPTLLSFAQLQNYMIATAMSKGWTHYYWGYMDTAVTSNEASAPFKSFYHKIVDNLWELKATMGPDAGEDRWAVQFCGEEWLTLVNVGALESVGAWDTFIPYSGSDCDWYERVRLAGLVVHEHGSAGKIFDVHRSLENPEEKFFGLKGENEKVNSKRFRALVKELQRIEDDRNDHTLKEELGEMGGDGEPWTYNAKAFQMVLSEAVKSGGDIYGRKWGTHSCSLIDSGKTLKDAWARDVGIEMASGPANSSASDEL
ncbi:hypothetical protein TWF696_005404 [Orbilia brochopaga]|uniref:Uncharacterized protein n=1 Tax=Orbilia brochopaga TaxID=3140254 RepID=A0AAV9V0Q8_9PEZI